ncbi:PAS domain S-box protein [Halorubrum sp. F4]|uniref:hybrid sensor histidine kinase/response regulator n=1 Tax=Halorubrum sp. F4 TaxID=2989715 RepID=UPI00248127E9|nr:PAS domain S-box protein [Halorubrum sp. F4]
MSTLSDTIRVLHVDDEPEFAEMTTTLLERENERLTVETAASASEGLDHVATNHVDCIVSDYDMPGLNGIEFLEAVREENPDLPFILFTGKGSEEVASDAISAGVTDYLQKGSATSQYAVLANRIRNAVEGFTAKRERRRHLDAIETAQEGISILDDGRFIYVNRAYADLYGYEPAEMIDERWELIYPDEEVAAVRDEILPTVAETGTWHGETTGLRADGSTFVEDHTLARTEGGELVCTVRDVTEREEREKRLERTTARLELAVEGANLGVWDWDMRTDEVEFNEKWAEMIGHTLEELEPHLDAWETRVHPDDLDDVEAALQAHIDGETPYYDTEHRMRTAEGDWKWIRDIGTVVERDDAGEPVRAVGIHLDVTDQKERERELDRRTESLEELTTELEEQYRYFFEQAPVMAAVTRTEDGKPVVEDCNQLFAETLGYSKDDVLGRGLAEFYTAESRRELLREGGYERALNGEFLREDRELSTADGETVEALLRAVPRHDARTNAVGTLAFYVDVSERKDLEQEKKRLEEFTSIVSHDLRNPLNVAAGRVDLARDECDSEHLEDAEDALDRMEELIDDLLRLARSGDHVDEAVPIDLEAAVRNCWRNVETADATLVIGIGRTIRADRSRVSQLFENLFRNSVEHGSTGSRAEPSDSVEHSSTGSRPAADDSVEHGGTGVTVTVGELDDGFFVEDDGTGIPEDVREDVFEAGYSTSTEGTGFGLSIVRQVAEAHGWTIRVTDGSEGGARFEITDVEFVET